MNAISPIDLTVSFVKILRKFMSRLKTCLRFGCNPQIKFALLLSEFEGSNLVFGSTFTKAYRHWVPCKRNSPYLFHWNYLKLCIQVLMLLSEDVHEVWL